jgi:hypothetical protein
MPGLRRPQRVPKLIEEESGVPEPEEHMCSTEAGKHFYVSSSKSKQKFIESKVAR